ncbi:hypothetical protein QFC20_006014 [Naganishia adeliensis]|uniref:Uncharacterized protein n=1 Tax=Naganishia adeliensis TaxID=92952 RepID=A0ACC2VFZ8_9TREE|nr:hypothetical protein QFC20_006014 [Naganishia adeliensis]
MEALYNASSHGRIPLQTGQLTFESGQENTFHTPQPGTYTNTTPSSITKPNSFSIYRDKLAAHESRRTKSRSADVRSYEASQVAAQLKRMDMQRKTRVAEVKGGRMEGVEIAAKGGKSGNPGSSVVARGGKEGKGRSESGNAGSTSRSKVSEDSTKIDKKDRDAKQTQQKSSKLPEQVDASGPSASGKANTVQADKAKEMGQAKQTSTPKQFKRHNPPNKSLPANPEAMRSK